jgi:DNA topoisomerase-3
MTPAAIRDGFAHLRTDEEMLPLADAARCRSESDWLIGINGTRAMTAFNSKPKAASTRRPWAACRRRPWPSWWSAKTASSAFVPRDYWEVQARIPVRRRHLSRAAGSTRNSRKPTTSTPAPSASGTRPRRGHPQGLPGKHGDVEEESKPKTEACPMLYDLTSLQREANGRFGFSAKNTLGLAQALYEKHKVLTYPRTDSAGTCPRTTSRR